jgi:hypothetical protein
MPLVSFQQDIIQRQTETGTTMDNSLVNMSLFWDKCLVLCWSSCNSLKSKRIEPKEYALTYTSIRCLHTENASLCCDSCDLYSGDPSFKTQLRTDIYV